LVNEKATKRFSGKVIEYKPPFSEKAPHKLVLACDYPDTYDGRIGVVVWATQAGLLAEINEVSVGTTGGFNYFVDKNMSVTVVDDPKWHQDKRSQKWEVSYSLRSYPEIDHSPPGEEPITGNEGQEDRLRTSMPFSLGYEPSGKEQWYADGQGSGNAKTNATAGIGWYMSTHKGELPKEEDLPLLAGTINTLARLIQSGVTLESLNEPAPEEDDIELLDAGDSDE